MFNEEIQALGDVKDAYMSWGFSTMPYLYEKCYKEKEITGKPLYRILSDSVFYLIDQFRNASGADLSAAIAQNEFFVNRIKDSRYHISKNVYLTQSMYDWIRRHRTTHYFTISSLMRLAMSRYLPTTDVNQEKKFRLAHEWDEWNKREMSKKTMQSIITELDVAKTLQGKDLERKLDGLKEGLAVIATA